MDDQYPAGGAEQFYSTQNTVTGSSKPGGNNIIYASDVLPTIVRDPSSLAIYSLAQSLKLPVPHLPPLSYLPDSARLTWRTNDDDILDLGLQVLQTSGHSLDHLVVLDHSDKVLFAADTTYERSPLLFMHGSCLVSYMETLERLEALIQEFNENEVVSGSGKRWIAACGHFTSGVDAQILLKGTREFMLRVLRGELPALSREVNVLTGIEHDFFVSDPMALSCPVSLIVDAQKCLDLGQ
jgi:glyoxylase-like metal-dependent hydrolase (beta-lactamase superfamily II)